jgi:hypothetical protein
MGYNASILAPWNLVANQLLLDAISKNTQIRGKQERHELKKRLG